MAFMKLTNAETGQPRLVNAAFVVYIERDTETPGAVVWWISYADPGQPRSKYLITTEPYEEVERLVIGGAAAPSDDVTHAGAAGHAPGALRLGGSGSTGG